MKMILGILNSDDAPVVIQNLNKAGYFVTRLSTSGGFLRAGNTTLLVGVDDDKFDAAMAVIERVCKSRKQIATQPASMAGVSGVYSPYPIEVTVGGATVFVLTVDQFIKL